MNASLPTTDRATHVKIVIVALVASMLVASIAISARVSGTGLPLVRQEIKMPIFQPSVPQVTPRPTGKTVLV
jgi:hypothetical protein